MASWPGAAAVALVGWLLTYMLHSTVLLVGAWSLCRRLSDRQPAACDRIWKIALLGGLATATLQMTLGLEPLLGRFELWVGSVVQGSAEPGSIAPGSSGVPGSSISTGIPLQLDPGLALAIAGLWSLLALISLARLVLRVRRFRRWLRRRPLGAGAERALKTLADLSETAGLARRPRLTVSDRLASPASFGSEICLPAELTTELRLMELRGVLAHEVAHLRRRDPVWSGIAGVMIALFPFQPLNRVARRQLQRTAELICDDWARSATGRPLALARALLEVAERVGAAVEPAVASELTSRASSVARRIERLLEDPIPERTSSAHRPLTLLAVVALASTTLLAPGFAIDHARPPVRNTSVASLRIDAVDPAGEFSLTLLYGRVVGATIEDVPVPDHLLVQTADSLRFMAPDGRRLFSVRIEDNGITWQARPAGWRAPELE